MRSRLDPNQPHDGIGSGARENQRTHPAQTAPANKLPELDDRGNELLDAMTLTGDLPKPKGLESADRDALTRWLADQPEAILLELAEDLDDSRRRKLAEMAADAMGVAMDNPLYDGMTDVIRQKEMEKRLEAAGQEIDVLDLFFGNVVKQTVPVHPRVNVTIGVVPSHQAEWLHRLAVKELPRSTQMYYREWFAARRLAIAVREIGGNPIKPELDTFIGESNYDRFVECLNARIQELMRLPDIVLQELQVQLAWFDVRVRKAMSGNPARKLGNS